MAVGTALAIAAGIGGAVSAAGSIAKGVGSARRKDPVFSMGAQSEFGAEGTRAAVLGQRGYQNAMENEVAQGSAAQVDLANLLRQYASNGAIPTAGDISRSNDYAATQFDPQRVAMQQAFGDQLTQANRQAAISGRGVNDPILRAKLAQEQTRQSAMLTSQQQAFSNQFAQQQPLQRLGFLSDRANTLVTRGQTALGNYVNQTQMGLAAQGQDFQQRFASAQAQYVAQANTRSKGEKIGEALAGIGAGIGGMANIGAGMANVWGKSGGEMGAPQTTTTMATPAQIPIFTQQSFATPQAQPPGFASQIPQAPAQSYGRSSWMMGY